MQLVDSSRASMATVYLPFIVFRRVLSRLGETDLYAQRTIIHMYVGVGAWVWGRKAFSAYCTLEVIIYLLGVLGCLRR